MKAFLSVISVAALLHLGCADPQYGAGSSSSSSMSAAASTTASSSKAVQTVTVGKAGLVFSPNSVTASQGDVIEFVISSGHSVSQSTFDNPCQPSGANAIYSGFPADGTIFSVTVNSTDPVWLYCSQVGHCQAGMAMAINPPSSGNTLAAYMSAAKSAGSSTSPANIGGGVFGAVSQSSGSSSSATSSSAPAATSKSGAGSLVADILLVAGGLAGGLAMILP